MSVNDDYYFMQLLDKYANNQASPEEVEELFALIKESGNDKELLGLLVDALVDTAPIIGDEKVWDQQFDQLLDEAKRREQDEEKTIKHIGWRRIAAAASILLFLSAGAYFWLHKQPVQQTAQNDPEQIAPVQKGVLLTLAKGQQIALNQKHNGQIANTGHTQISQMDSVLRYQGNGSVSEKPELNTLTNNSGAKFSVTLADGSQATLDVASSLTYPVAFSRNDRRVSMTGQVYFKVKHEARQRFLVYYKNEVTQDIGTEFNINAYDDEPKIKTTLISGVISVRLSKAKTGGLLLRPGEQVIASGDEMKVAPANIEETTAWLQEQMVFHHETLENILRNVARVYNVTIIWQDPETKKLTFGGSVTRSEKLATVLNYFRKAGNVDFLVEGRTVKVFKKKK
jgi:transmembrane sensor